MTSKHLYHFTIPVCKEQIDYAKQLVNFSLENHPISNIWDSKKKDDTPKLRLTGTLGEIIFADTYKLERPVKSFGAVDGQDFGKDFEMNINKKQMNFDIKTMRRKSDVFYENYVLNIPARNLNQNNNLTDCYFCISIHEKKNVFFASLLGYIFKQDILNSKCGILYKKGSSRKRADKSSFEFYEDTYEIDFKDIRSPFLNQRIRNIKGFKIGSLKK
jgi:hypothetical protein